MHRLHGTLATLALLGLALGGCVTKGTDNIALGSLATAESDIESLRAEIERREQVEEQLRNDLTEAAQAKEASDEASRQEIARLQREIQRLDALQGQAHAEVARLETALGQRGSEYRQLQQRLESLSAIEREIRERNQIYEDR